MATLNDDLRSVETPKPRYGSDESEFWRSGVCPNCGPSSFLVVAGTTDGNFHPDGRLEFLRCVACRRGAVSNLGVVSPGTSPLGAVEGCPSDVEAAWMEVRSNLSVGAATSAAMMCRKLLFHIAVEQGLPPEGDKGRAPTFEACLTQLRQSGLLTPPLEPWVGHIKDVGNKANHDLAVISAEDARRVATFTRQLLVTAYEMPHRMREALGVPPGEEPDTLVV